MTTSKQHPKPTAKTTDDKFIAWMQEVNDRAIEQLDKHLVPDFVERRLKEIHRKAG